MDCQHFFALRDGYNRAPWHIERKYVGALMAAVERRLNQVRQGLYKTDDRDANTAADPVLVEYVQSRPRKEAGSLMLQAPVTADKDAGSERFATNRTSEPTENKPSEPVPPPVPPRPVPSKKKRRAAELVVVALKPHLDVLARSKVDFREGSPQFFRHFLLFISFRTQIQILPPSSPSRGNPYLKYLCR